MPLNVAPEFDEPAENVHSVNAAGLGFSIQPIGFSSGLLNAPKNYAADSEDEDDADGIFSKLRNRQSYSCHSGEKWLTDLARGMDQDIDTWLVADFLDKSASRHDHEADLSAFPADSSPSPAWILAAEGWAVYGIARMGQGRGDQRRRNFGWHDDAGPRRAIGRLTASR